MPQIRSQAEQRSVSPTCTAQLEITRAKHSDMRRVAGFIRSSAEWYAKFLDEKDLEEHYVDDRWIEKNFFRRDFYLGRNEDREPVGTISIQSLNGIGYLGYIYLDVKHVGKGYGHRLMEFAKKECRRRGYRGISLIAHPQATWAVKAYKKFGFEKIAQSREAVLQWNDGALKPYYEEGFELYYLPL